MSTKLLIEVVYALPNLQTVLSISVNEGITISEAIDASGIYFYHPELLEKSLDVGIFGCSRQLSYSLCDGDRIEIYRPLIADPKELRRLRAKSGRREKVAINDG